MSHAYILATRHVGFRSLRVNEPADSIRHVVAISRRIVAISETGHPMIPEYKIEQRNPTMYGSELGKRSFLMSEDWIKQFALSRRAKWDAVTAENQRMAVEMANWSAHYAEFWKKLVDGINSAVTTYNKTVGIRDLFLQISHDDTDLQLSPAASGAPVVKMIVDQIGERLTVKCDGGNGKHQIQLDYALELGKEGLVPSFNGIEIPEEGLSKRVLELFFERIE